MKNRFRLAITALTILIVAACLFVSCNDDVITHKDNGNSYSEVLESNGAFVFKGNNYETLQEAIDAAAKASTAKAISSEAEAILVTGNVKSRGITIPAETEIVIDLKGFEIQFFDVETGAITVGESATFLVSNGTLYMADKKEGLIVISAGNKAEVGLGAGLKIKANGQTAILLDGSVAEMAKNVVVEGATVAEGGSKLIIYNSLSDVRMNGVDLYIWGSGSAVVTEIVGEDNGVFVSPTGTIIDQSESGGIKPKDIEDSVCYIKRGGEVLTFGSLKEALVSVEEGDEVYFFRAEEAGADITLEKSATIKLMVSSTQTNNITLADDVALTIDVVSSNLEEETICFKGSISGGSSLVLNDVTLNGSIETGSLSATKATVIGTVDLSGKLDSSDSIFSDAVDAGEVDDEGSVFYGDIEADGNVTLTGSFFASTTVNEVTTSLYVTSEDGNVVITESSGTIGKVETKSTKSDSGSVKIDNSGFEEAPDYGLAVGEIKANGGITLVGLDEDYSVLRVTGPVSGNDITAKYCTFDSQGESKSINGNTVMVKYSHFVYDLDNEPKYYSITTTGEDIPGEDPSKDVSSLSISLSYGRVGDLRAEGGSVYVLGSNQGLEVGDICAHDAEETPKTYYDVTIAAVTTGSITADNLDTTVATVNGDVVLTGYMKSTGSTFYGAVSANKTVDDNGSTFTKNISAVGDITITSSTFASASEPASYPAIESTAGSIVLTKVSGQTSTLTASAEGKNITINNALATATLITGAIKAGDAVVVKGSLIEDVIHYVTVGGTVDAVSLDVTYATVDDKVTLDGGNLISNYSVFTVNADVLSANVVDVKNSTVKGDISATDYIVFENTVFEIAPVITSESGYIEMTNSTGEVGDITAAVSVEIDDSETVASFTTGVIWAKGGSVCVKRAGSTYTTTVEAIKAHVDEEIPETFYDVTIAKVTTGSITANNLDTTEATVNGTVDLRGKLDSVRSEFTPETEEDYILADEIVDDGSVFDGEFTITAVKSIVFEDSKFNASPDVTSATGSIKMTNATGEVGDLTASGKEQDVTINNSKAGETLTTGKIKAGNVVSVTGAILYRVSVTGEVNGATVEASNANFSSTIRATEGDVTLASARIVESANVRANIEAINGNTRLTRVTGTAGNLWARKGNVTIDNTQIYSGYLTTGAIAARDSVSVKGRNISSTVTVDGIVYGSTLDAVYTVFSGAITTTAGDVTLADSTFNNNHDVVAKAGNINMTRIIGSVGNLTAANVTIDNSEVGYNLNTGSITADVAVTVTGVNLNDKCVNITGKVSAVTMDALYVYVTSDGSIDISGDLNSSDSIFAGSVSAATVTDERSSFTGDAIFAKTGNVTLTGSKISVSDVTSANGSILMTNVANVPADNIVAAGALTASNVTIDNAQAKAEFTTGAIEAVGGAVTLTGNLNYGLSVGSVTGATLNATNTTVTGAVDLTGELNSADSTFSGSVSAATVVDERSIFGGDSITAKVGNVTLTGSSFDTDTESTNHKDVISDAGSIEMTNVTGTAGALTASADGSEITIINSNSQIFAPLTTGKLTASNVTVNNALAGATLETGDIEADDAVTLTGGNSSTKLVIVTGKVSGVTLNATYVEMTSDGSVDISGDLNSADSIFAGSVSAATVTDERSSFTGDAIFAKTGNVTLTGSKISVSDVTSANGSILMTNVANVPADNIVAAGALTASNVTIDNAQAKAEFTTGAIEAVGGAVTLTGNLNYGLSVGSVTGLTLDATHATVTGAVLLDGELTASDSAFYESVSATVVTDNRSTFTGTSTGTSSIIATEGDVTLTGSIFAEPTKVAPAIMSANGNIVMTNVTKKAGALTASIVTVDNAQAKAEFTTGAIEAVGGAVTLTGNLNYGLSVGSVTGLTLDATHATVNGAVSLYGELTSEDSEFKSTISATVVTDNRSTFKGSISAKTGDVTLTGSRFAESTEVAPAIMSANGNIVMTNVTKKAGALTAYDVTINNASATFPLETGVIEADGAVTVTGNSSKMVTVRKDSETGLSVKAASLDATYAIVEGEVNLTGELKSADSTFSGSVNATIVTDNRSTFTGTSSNITATEGDVILTGSKISGPNVTSESGTISMTNVTNVPAETVNPAGTLTASSVKIDNVKVGGTLATGAITADNAVEVKGGNSTTKLVSVSGGIKGSTLVATYAALKGSIETTTSVSVTNCTVGDGTNDYVNSPSINIVGSTMNLLYSSPGRYGLEADYVTINTPAAGSVVSSINTKDLTVTAEDLKLSVGSAAASRKITINGGTYGGFTFSGSDNSSTISSGTFHGIFEHVGTATLTITGGSFVKDPSLTSYQYQKLNSGKTIINGTYSNTYGWNLVFDNLSIDDDYSQCEIQSGYFKAATAGQLNNIGKYIKQSTSSPTKFVALDYTANTISSYSKLTLPSSADVKKAVVSFSGNPVVDKYNLYFEYPDTVELKGSIVLESDAYRVYTYNRQLNDSSSLSVVWRKNSGSYNTRIDPYLYEANRWYYDYDN